MPKLTKAELQKMAEEMADDGTATLFDQDEINEIVKARLAKEADKLTSAATEASQAKAEAERLRAELQAVKDEATGKTKTVQEQLQTELEKREAAIKAWEQKVSEAEQSRKKIETQYHTEHRNRTLQSLLGKAGAAKEGLEHAAFICGTELDGVIQVVAENGKPKVKAVDPLLQKEVDLTETVKAWLDKNPHFKGSSPSGPGSSGAGPNDPPPKPPPSITEGRSPMDALRAANRELAKPKGR
jgi:DNA repair exonuclease SbcCD ATPase subunit